MTSFVAVLALRARYRERIRLVEQRADPRSARATGASSCQRSGVCCWTRPCELHPGDVERLAEHLHVSPTELFQTYLVVDEFDHGLALVPRRVEQSAGRRLTDEETYDADTPCVFLDGDGGSCRVHEAKPTGGAQWWCGMSESERLALPRPAWSLDDLRRLGYESES